MGNIDENKLLGAINQLSGSGKLQEAVKKRDMGGIMSSLDKAQAAELKKLMADKAAMQKLLQSEQAQKILKALQNDGK